MAYQRKQSQAIGLYLEAQQLARKHAFLGVLAIACDREAFTRKEFGMPEQTECYLKAISCYEEWGAFAKSSRMKKTLKQTMLTSSSQD